MTTAQHTPASLLSPDWDVSAECDVEGEGYWCYVITHQGVERYRFGAFETRADALDFGRCRCLCIAKAEGSAS
ncbi:MAG: hypothetical protein JSR41_09870 [Proteobacteria bacterium]|nr:hypothetical protein [Pseudomonadota bacterium]